MKRLAIALFFTTVCIALLSACTGLQRSHSSGYEGRDSDAQAIGRDRKFEERSNSASELGYGGQRLSESQAEAADLRSALRKAEKNLEGHRERDQYFKNKPYMRSDRDRLEFLRIGSYEARSRWLNAKGIQGSATPNSPEIQSLVDINDITTGMTKQAVRDSWGEPELVEVAGNPLYGNERWSYNEQLPSTEGYQTEHRMVYFESGRVVGWEKK
jgi:hypothetical protein